MSDFLLELRSEEVPARMQAGARADLEKLFRKEMDAAGVAVSDITVWSTPRRLVLIAKNLPQATEAVSEEVKGPRTSAPEQALEGFLRKTGLSKDQLTERDGVWFAVSEKPGRATCDVLAEAIPAIIRQFPWPKSMRWGAESISTESTRWVRPLSGIVSILGEELVECEAGGVRSGFATRGHRFHHPGEITIGSAADYREKLSACHVLVDHEERQDLIRDKARAAAEAAGLVLVEDEGLVVENAGLTEWPVPLLGRFDEAYLEVPPEVIQLTARVNQKYFVCEQGGSLANAFVCTANIDATDGGEAIVAGNRKVLAARLSDARFFWEQDRKKSLAQHAEGLARITFHEKLGTVADKVERVARLARWLVEQGIVGSNPALATNTVRPEPVEGPSFTSGAAPEEQGSASTSSARTGLGLADLAEQAARLCKADLVTEMVGEFPELQGLMGGYYARAEGLPDAVADAIRDHYKPVGQGDEVPSAPVTVAVSLADKLDTISAFFGIDQKPTGSKDPFALRRAALGSIELITANRLRLDLTRAIRGALANRAGQAADAAPVHRLDRSAIEVLDFFADRLKVQQREAGIRHDLIDAVFAVKNQDGENEDDLVRLLARVHALQAFVATQDGANLLAGYKRAANILKAEEKKGWADGAVNPAPEMAEKALIEALDAAGPTAAAAVAAEDFAGAMAALASLRAPIDAFFDHVTVNDADAQKRAARLSLLARFRDAVHQVADFSKIEG
ncbi:MAG: glycine--tRNA ligase subunit beta [Novosphingobium sp.]